MKRVKLLSVVVVTLLAVGCMKVKETEADGEGDIFPQGKAIDVITSSPRWCYQDVDGDKIFWTHVFLETHSGIYALYDSNTEKYIKTDSMSWSVSGDRLTMIMPDSYKPKNWVRKMRFLTASGVTQLVLVNDEAKTKTTLTPCNI